MGNPTRRLTRFLGIGSDSRGITGLETAIVLIAFVVVSSVFAFAALSTGLFSSDKSKETIRAGLDEASGTLGIRGVVMAKGLVVTNETVIADDEAGQTGSLASTPVVDGSQTIADPSGGNMTKVSSSPSAGEYTINLDTGLVTIGVDADATNDAITADYTAQLIDDIYVQVANSAGGGAVDLTPGETLVTYTDADQSLTLATADMTVTALGNADTDKLVEVGEMYEIKLSNLVGQLTTDLPKDKAFTLEIKPPVGAVYHVERRSPVVLEKVNDLG